MFQRGVDAVRGGVNLARRFSISGVRAYLSEASDDGGDSPDEFDDEDDDDASVPGLDPAPVASFGVRRPPRPDSPAPGARRPQSPLRRAPVRRTGARRRREEPSQAPSQPPSRPLRRPQARGQRGFRAVAVEPPSEDEEEDKHEGDGNEQDGSEPDEKDQQQPSATLAEADDLTRAARSEATASIASSASQIRESAEAVIRGLKETRRALAERGRPSKRAPSEDAWGDWVPQSRRPKLEAVFRLAQSSYGGGHVWAPRRRYLVSPKVAMQGSFRNIFEALFHPRVRVPVGKAIDVTVAIVGERRLERFFQDPDNQRRFIQLMNAIGVQGSNTTYWREKTQLANAEIASFRVATSAWARSRGAR